MNKIAKGVFSILCAATMSTGFASCIRTRYISAYDIAVKNGFVGTEKEWLLSLKGDNGKDAQSLTFEDLYETARKGGYEGSLLDFCLEIGVDVVENNDTARIAQCISSVVSINCAFEKDVKSGFGWASMTTSEYYGSSAGSGVILDLNQESGSAYIVTNYHVVYDSNCNTENNIANRIYVYTYGGRELFDAKTGYDTSGDYIQATFVGGAMDYDIAILKVEGSEVLKESIARAANVGSSDDVKVGEKTYVVGNPEGAGIAMTSGAISVDSEYITMTSTDSKRYVDYRVIRTDAAVNGGNSGGALFNANGELIGIVNAKSVGEDLDNMGYALPITQVKAICKNLWDNAGVVKRAMLGIMVYTEASEVAFDENGDLITKETFVVSEANTIGSSSYGKFKVGDVFQSMRINNGEKIELTRQYKLHDALLTVRKGDKVTFGMIRRDNNVGEIEVEILFDKDEYFTVYA
jgi:serine protease Do